MSQIDVRLKRPPEGMSQEAQFVAWKYEPSEPRPIWVFKHYHASTSDKRAPLRAVNSPDLPLGGWIVGFQMSVDSSMRLKPRGSKEEVCPVKAVHITPMFVYRNDMDFQSEWEVVS